MEPVSPELSPQSASAFASRCMKLALKAAVSIVALLMLRGIIGSLPMLKNTSAMNESFLGDSLLSPSVIAEAIIDTVVLAVILTFGLRLAHNVRGQGQRFAQVGSTLSHATLLVVLIFAYKMYELPAACFFVGRTDLVNLNTVNTAPSGAYGDFIRAWGQVISQVNASAIQNASGESLAAYQRLALAMFRRPPDYYAWAFLILIAIPVFSLVPLVYRNLDTMADLLAHGAAVLQGSVASADGTGLAPSNLGARDMKPVAPANQPAVMTLREIVDKLVKLKALLDAGAISPTDFAGQKERILAVPVVPSAHHADPDDFIRLKAMFEAGALTEAEYEAQKQRALLLI